MSFNLLFNIFIHKLNNNLFHSLNKTLYYIDYKYHKQRSIDLYA
jgi:hypothetical protein